MLAWIGTALAAAATLFGGWLGTRIVTPKDHERAALVAVIASGAAALVVSMYPGKPWAELLELIVRQIEASAGLPTRNTTAIKQAAAKALAALGKPPVAR